MPKSDRFLTDDEIRRECVPCYCDRCGMQLWMHLLYPRVGADLLEYHGCVPKPPVLFQVEVLELKPYDIPVSKIFDLDWNREQYEHQKIAFKKLNDE